MPFSERRIATSLVPFIFEKIKIIITVIGTERIIPMIPQIAPHTLKERITTNELMFKEFPIIFGSKKLPTNN